MVTKDQYHKIVDQLQLMDAAFKAAYDKVPTDTRPKVIARLAEIGLDNEIIGYLTGVSME